MRPRFSLILICLFSLLSSQALLAQSTRRQPEKRGSTSRSRRETESPRRGKESSRTPRKEAEISGARPKTTRSTEKKEASSGRRTPSEETREKKPVKETAESKKPDTAAAVKPAAATKPKAAGKSSSAVGAADRAYFQKNYKTALGLYQDALKQKLVSEGQRPIVDYRIARCLGFMEQWDASISESLRLGTRYSNTIWDARSKSWLMRLYLKAPHTGWKVGDRFVRGADAPEVEDAARPEQLDLQPEDWRKSVQAGEQARLLYEKLRSEVKGTAEEADFATDLARTLSGTQLPNWARQRTWKPQGDDVWKLDPAASYDPSWPLPRKVLQLYLSAEEIGTPAQKPLIRLAQAIWLRTYQQTMQREAWRADANGNRVPIPYPYQERSAMDVLRSFLRDYPEHGEGDHTLLMIGNWYAQDERFNDALGAYDTLIKARADTRWAGVARAAVASITRAQLNVEAPEPQAPGKKATLRVGSRNVPELKLSAYSVKLEELVKDGRALSRPRTGIQELFSRLGKAGVRKYYQGEPVTWEQPLTYKQEYVASRRAIETPLTKNGAYVVEVDGGPVRATVLLVISDLAAFQVVDQERATAMVVNAETGAPVADASVLIREVYRDAEKKVGISAATSATSPEGLAEKPLSPKGVEGSEVSIFAWKGDRYAFTKGGVQWRNSLSDAGQHAYVYTDRPTYRPSQRVNFRALLSERAENGSVKPLAGQKARARLLNPEGNEVDARDVTADQFGAAHGFFELASRPPLGEYSLELAWGEKDARTKGTAELRVEEYKKPEFAVTVAPAGGPIVSGQPVKVRISARYYFGAPVVKARVRYSVMREALVLRSPFGSWGAPDLWDPKQNDPRVAAPWERMPELPLIEGSVETDASGDAVITVDTKIPDPRFAGRHLNVFVAAEVMDSSRRTVRGSGDIPVSGAEYNAFISPRLGFVAAGDTLEADLRTLGSNGEPVAVLGTVRVLRRRFENRQLVTEEAYSAPVRTDPQGRGLFFWNSAPAGRYLLQFEGRDSAERLVRAVAETWVAGDAAADGFPAVDQVKLIQEAATQRVGQKARVLIVTGQPDTTILLTTQAGNRVLDKRIVRMDGRSKVLELPITAEHSPDVVLGVSGVRLRRFFHERFILQVPPTDQRLTVEVTPDKSVYKPGERATFRVRARDVDGRPVRAECSVGVVDASLFYFGSDSTSEAFSAVYPGGRGTGIWPADSVGASFDQLSENDQAAPKEVDAKWQFPRLLGNIEREVFAELPGDPDWNAIAAAPVESPNRAPAAAEMGSLARLEGVVAKIPKITGAINVGARAAEPVKVRSKFADVAFWAPEVITGENGEATVSFTWPDNLTTWAVTGRGWTESVQIGEGRAEVTTSKDLLVRLQSPRFFVERDELVLSANVHNYTSEAQRVKVALQLEGDTLFPAGSAPPGPPAPKSITVPRADRPGGTVTIGEESASAQTSPVQWIDLPPGAEKRVDWRVRVDRAGAAKVRVLAEAPADSDAVELTFPVLAHGVEKHVIKAGSILTGGSDKPRSAKVTVTVPSERAPDAGELVVQVSPSAGMVMLDALPYLADYPYGCTEQTMSRFMPLVVSAKVLQDLGVDLADLRKRGSGPGAPGRKAVFEPDTRAKMVAEGMERLRRFQHSDGAWGWWEDDSSDEQITAYVLQGLLTGREAGVPVPAAMIDRGMAYLAARFAKETGPHDRAYMAWVLSLEKKRAKDVAATLLASDYPQRERLTAYGLALLALALKNGGAVAEARICMQNLENTAKIDKEAGTCSWTRNSGSWWNWYNQDVETAATCLRVFNALEPKHRLAPLVVRWLSNNRTGASWSSTRDTAMAVYALAEYVRGQKELAPDYTLTVDVGGRHKKSFKVTAENALTFDNRLTIPATSLGSGAQEITVTREGEGNVYFTASLRYFTLEEGIQGAGNEIRVRRRYFRLTKAGEEAKEKTKDGYVRTPVAQGDKVTSGDLLEVELLLESKNSYEYLVFEDTKPSGCEPVELRSGARYGNGLCSNVELRDAKVAFFITRLPQGKRLISYRLRAETPGTFHALPLTGYAMYAPAVRCISDEGGFGVEDAPADGPVARKE